MTISTVKELFGSQTRETERLSRELETHLATWPAVMAEFDRIDRDECLPAAHKLVAEQAAGSPAQFETQSNLKRSRWRRDAIKSAFTRERDRLQRELETLTMPVITDFHQSCLDRLRNLSSECRYERVEGTHDFGGKRQRYTVVIKTNGDALARLRDGILRAIETVRELRHRPLSEIKKQIMECRRELEAIDLLELVQEEVSEQEAADRRPQKDTGELDRGTQMPGGKVWVHPPKAATSQIKGLADRISALEGR